MVALETQTTESNSQMNTLDMEKKKRKRVHLGNDELGTPGFLRPCGESDFSEKAGESVQIQIDKSETIVARSLRDGHLV